MKSVMHWSLAALIFVGLTFKAMAGSEETKAELIAAGKEVKINYTLTVEGVVKDSTSGGEPLTYVQGKGMMIPGLEKKLEGHKVGDKFQADIGPEDAYGAVNPKAYVEVPLEKLPKEGLQVGALMTTTNQDGQPIHAVVDQIKEKTAVMNFNHPLAGKQLHFDVEVVAIK